MESPIRGLKPERLWDYFEVISKIPRCSRNKDGITAFIQQFARKNGLDFKKDADSNIIVVKPASPGFERMPGVVLQSHVDMVCEKNAQSVHNFTTDPIILKVEKNWVKAEETTLGADNGIGIAAMLSILENQRIKTGRLECLFTVDEEIGLIGAFNLEQQMIKGRFLINLDTEEVGSVCIGCAGGRDTHIVLPVQRIESDPKMTALELRVTGLAGGHSGVEIHLGRANAIKLMARILFHLKKFAAYRMISFSGGDKLNAIPREAFAVIAVNRDQEQKVKEVFNDYGTLLKMEYSQVEPHSAFSVIDHNLSGNTFNVSSTEKCVNLLSVIPHGVLVMSSVVEGLVETSTNLASVKSEGNEVHIKLSHRSSVESALNWVCDFHTAISQLSDAVVTQNKGYPGWSPDDRSELLGHAKKSILKITGREAEVMAVHAGLECAVIKQKIKDMDVISIGPTIVSPHSPDERVDTKSVETFWKILLEVLKNIYDKSTV